MYYQSMVMESHLTLLLLVQVNADIIALYLTLLLTLLLLAQVNDDVLCTNLTVYSDGSCKLQCTYVYRVTAVACTASHFSCSCSCMYVAAVSVRLCMSNDSTNKQCNA
jgi:hypothetical protein